MSHILTIFDEKLSGEKTKALDLCVASSRLTVRDLVAARIRQEVDRYNDDLTTVQSPEFRGLVRPEEAEVGTGAYRLKRARPIDAKAQIARAIALFEGNGSIVLVNDRQAESLEEEIVVTDATQVSFLRLMPLVGG